jgi:hypothetical protein
MSDEHLLTPSAVGLMLLVRQLRPVGNCGDWHSHDSGTNPVTTCRTMNYTNRTANNPGGTCLIVGHSVAPGCARLMRSC